MKQWQIQPLCGSSPDIAQRSLRRSGQSLSAKVQLATLKSYEMLIPAVISKHYEAVTAYGLGFEGHTWQGQNQQSWRWVHTIARAGPGQQSLVMAGHDSIFKREHVQLQQNALWIFDCRQGSSANPQKAWSHHYHKTMVFKTKKLDYDVRKDLKFCHF